MDIVFDSVMAWNQIGLAIGGLVLIALGSLFFSYMVYRRITCDVVRGRIVAVRATGIVEGTDKVYPEEGPVIDDVKESFSEGFKKQPVASVLGLLLAFLMVVLPAVFVIIGGWFAYDYMSLKTTGVEAKAEVVRYEENYDPESGTAYYAVVSFKTQDGRSVEAQSRMSGKPAEEGDKITVFYEEDDPEHMVTEGFWHNMFLPMAFMGIGGVFLFLLFGGLNGMQKKEKKTLKQDYTGEMYYPVFEYTTRSGEKIRAEGDSSSNWIAGKMPGTRVSLLVNPDDPQDLSHPKIKTTSILGLCFLLPGLMMLYIALTRFEFNVITLVFILGLLMWAGFKLKKIIKPGSEWETKTQFKERMKTKRDKKRGQGRILTPQEIRVRVRYYDRHAGFWVPIMVLIAAGMMIGGMYAGKDMHAFLSTAQKAEGRVIGIDSRYDSSSDGSGYTYYPIVEFTDIKGKSREFSDDIGSDPPVYRSGDEIQVYYDPDSPLDAMIDRGIFNWTLSVVFFGGGALFFLWSLSLAASIRSRRTRL